MFIIRYLHTLIPVLFLLTVQFRQVISFTTYLNSRRPISSNRKLSFTTNNIDNSNTEYTLNVGKALDTLVRELPLLFAVKNIDFTILSSQITVVDENQHTLVVSKAVYIAAIRAIQMASIVSSNYPSIRIRKIEYTEDIRTIECLVDIALSSNQFDENITREDRLWEGMFYFGLNKEGLIETHIIDRKISNLKPEGMNNCYQIGKLCNE